MPILNDIMDDEVFGPLLRQGRSAGKRDLVLLMLSDWFGPLPDWAVRRLQNMSIAELDQVAVGFRRATSLRDLLP